MQNIIPAELRARNQWVVWRSVVGEGSIRKPPFNPRAPEFGADVNDPATWGSFEEALRTWQENPSFISGIGYVFHEDDGFFGIDIDDEAKVKQENLPARRELVNQILTKVNTYTEISPSGKGLHLIGKGRLAFDGKASSSLGFEVYHHRRYFTITGNVFDHRGEITDQQEFLNALFAAENQRSPVVDTYVQRRTDLSDEEVIRLATNYNPTFAPRFNAQVGCEPGEWSETFMAVVGTIERFTGLVEQVERIIMNSPMVMSAAPAPNGELRYHKAKRTFQMVLRRVRDGNNGQLYFVEHGRKIVEAMEAAKVERAKAAAETVKRASKAIAAGRIFDAFPMLDDQHRELTRPPGLVGQFVEATEAACYLPFTKFSIPATLASLAGIIGRGYKLPGGGGLNLNFILAAPTNAGKTQTSEAWEMFMDDAASVIGNDLQGPSRNRMLMNGTSSIQGIYEDFMKTPSCCWTIEECASQMNSMSNPQTPTELQLRDAYNMLYDAAKHGKWFTPPRSIANRKANYEPINNLAVSTYWTTTTSKFDIQNADALDGFMSRVVIVRHSGPAGERTRRPEKSLPQGLKQALVTLLGNAKRLDETYEISHSDAARMITHVSSQQIDDLKWEIHLIVDKIRHASQSGELPEAYTSLSRLPVTAERVAGLLAVIENPYTPSITAEQYLWSFGYLMQNALAIMHDMDAGELGSKATDETLAVIRAWRTEVERYKGKNVVGVLRSDLRRRCMNRAPFADMKQGSKIASDTIDYMVKEGMLVEIEQPGATAKKRVLAPTDDPIWQL